MPDGGETLSLMGLTGMAMAQDLLQQLVAVVIPAAADMRLLGLKVVAEFLDVLERQISSSEVLLAYRVQLPGSLVWFHNSFFFAPSPQLPAH